MKQAFILSKNAWLILIPFSLFGFLFLGSFFLAKPTPEYWSLAVSIDLLITIPLVYFLLIRKTKIPVTTVIPVIFLGLILGSFILPAEDQTYLTFFKTWCLPLLEGFLLIFIIHKVRQAIKSFKKEHKNIDFFDALKETSRQYIPARLVNAFALEVAVFYYGFIKWKPLEIAPNEFTYHKKSSSISLMIGIIMILAIESFALHFLLLKWNLILAWIITGISIYTLFQFIGFAKSLAHRPILLNQEHLVLRFGIMNETYISWQDIDSIVLSEADLEKDKLTKKLSLLGELDSHNVIIKLKKENILHGLYGIKRNYSTIAFYSDEPTELKKQIEQRLEEGLISNPT